MSKITGFDIGDPNKPFQVVGSHLGGRDQAITIARPRASVRGDEIEALAKQLSSNAKAIRKAIDRLEAMQDMMSLDDDTESVILDKNFVDEYRQHVAEIKQLFDEMMRATQQ